MKIDKGGIINDFIQPNKVQYAIPVYQRNYAWSKEQCRKLFDDIIAAHKGDHDHFCGSIVFAPIPSENKINKYIIIDGQQRYTTIYILIKALVDMAETERQKSNLSEDLFNVDKFNQYGLDEASKLKLKPIKSDNNQLILLMSNKYEEMDQSCEIYRNYMYFRELIKDCFESHPDYSVENIYDGIERLTCALIKLEDSDNDNAQEIFERINSTGVPLTLADKIRNFVLMTDKDQDRLYEEYWLKSEQLLGDYIGDFFLDYLNMRLDGFAKGDIAYDQFKDLFSKGKYSNESLLQEILHYAQMYHIFYNGSKELNDRCNRALKGFIDLKQTTVYLFLFTVFDDYKEGIINQDELADILEFLLNYTIRRMICEVGSNSLRGLYKSLYGRVFNKDENKSHYYDSLVSFMTQLTSKDVFPTDEKFQTALINNNLYKKNALCRYILLELENQGKEQLIIDNLTIEHIIPQNKSLSKGWREMLGDNWAIVQEKYLHTLGNLTLTGYNSELGDKPFKEKKEKLSESITHVTLLFEDVKDKDSWNEESVKNRGKRLSLLLNKKYPTPVPETEIDFSDPRYALYTCEDSSQATHKIVNYYELLGERVNTDSFIAMTRSVASKLYELDSSKIEHMARNNGTFPGWKTVVFSYDKNAVNGENKLSDSDIYIAKGFSAHDCISLIRKLLELYDLDLTEDFAYSARAND